MARFILKQGLRAYHAQQLGKTIDEVPEVRYDEKKATLSKNGKAGTRGILHWRLNENATVTTEDPSPIVRHRAKRAASQAISRVCRRKGA